MATTQRGESRYWCNRCRRALVNDGAARGDEKDTITPLDLNHTVEYKHDGCGGSVVAHSRGRM